MIDLGSCDNGSPDRAAYQRFPERPDDFWDDAEAWGAE